MDFDNLLGLAGVLAVGLYWWFGRRRPEGILWTPIVALLGVIAWHRATGQEEFRPFAI